MDEDAIAATPASARIEALDFVRGAALFGILLLNVAGFGLPVGAYTNPRNWGGAAGGDLWVWIVAQVAVEGTQRALFSILFGAGVILLTSRLDARREPGGRLDTARIYLRRNLWLIGFGLANAYLLLWYGDILYAYGVAGLALFAFRKMPAQRLVAFGVLALLASALWNASDTAKMLAAHDAAAPAIAARAGGADLSHAQHIALAAWDQAKAQFEADPGAMREEIEARTNGYPRAFAYNAGFSVYWQTWGLIRYFFDVIGMMLIGMGLFRAGVLTLEKSTATYAAMTIVGYAIGVTVNILETQHIVAGGFGALAFSEANLSYDVGRLATTIGHLGALLLFVRSGALPRLRRAVAAVGRMALTSYLTHSLVGAIIFVGLRQFGQWERHQLYWLVAAIWAFQLVASPVWLRHFRFGPAEWLWRALTYGSRPPMRRGSARPPPAAEAL